ncbi:WLM domain-containing protein [Apodospora peruviana]|uniref:WLM domain-containing protein n=1 Tax=Apodospora peruviana TaxID=516989 RepID=A0AAE0IR98_9PEZI|nr:WLM domain-containing protein [Apodospora peruviana]
MPEHDALVHSYSHLRNFPREKEALHSLKKVASLVKPIMRARGWTVGELAEFYPDQNNLLGLNVNRGQKILVRLRYPYDKTQFLPLEQVVDTMLHELSHIVHGPHDAKFHALWNQLRDEHEGLVRKGYTGEGFLSEGHRLGGGRQGLPMHEARRLARAAAEKRRVLTQGSGQRLGGSAPRPGEDIRNVIVSAIERRNKALQGCGNTTHNESEIREISDQATRNGFRTKAEEDAANEAAIAQALWELVQEDERSKYGDSYIPPSQQNPTGNGGGAIFGGSESDYYGGSNHAGSGSGSSSTVTKPKPSPPRPLTPPQIPVATKPEASRPKSPDRVAVADTWACPICTLVNPASFLCCDACGVERSTEVSQELANKAAAARKRPRAAVVDLTTSPATGGSAKQKKGATSSKGTAQTQYVPPLVPAPTWQCSFCGKIMEQQWWTCSTCGRMKDKS